MEPKRMLLLAQIRHSVGALVAVDAYFEAPERVAALILVAPAIVAPFTRQKIVKENQTGDDNHTQETSSDPNTSGNRFFSKLSTFAKNIAGVIIDAMKALYQKALLAILRSAAGVIVIRMIINKFGVPAVRFAWYDANEVSDHVIQGYTKPLKVKGWEKALVEYRVILINSSPLGMLRNYHEPFQDPRSNLPQEEKAEEFVSIVDKFLQRVFFGVVDEPSLQAAT